MGALAGWFTDSQQNKWIDQLFATTLYLAMLTSRPSRLVVTEVVSTQTLTGFTDFAMDSSVATRISSAAHPFVAADQTVVITGGTGWTKATYTISSLTGSAANLATSPAVAGATGGTGSVVRSTGYVRVALPPGTFAAAINGRTQNNTAIALPSPTGDWGEVEAFGLYDAITGGNLLAIMAANTPRVISAGDTARVIAAGALYCSRT